MIARLLVTLFGGIWKVKEKCLMKNRFFSKFYIFLYNYYQFEHGSSVSYKMKYSEKLIFPRGMKQVVIAEDVVFGKNCTVYQQVTIDNCLLKDSKSLGVPKIGDDCIIYPGAKIIGNIVIGNNVIIGANAVVENDIADNTVVR